MISESKMLAKRRKTTERLERAGLIPKSARGAHFGAAGDFKYVDSPPGYGPPLRGESKSTSRRSVRSKATLG